MGVLTVVNSGAVVVLHDFVHGMGVLTVVNSGAGALLHARCELISPTITTVN